VAAEFRNADDKKKAEALYSEIKANYADAIDHDGKLLVDGINSGAK
jgi:hypothetical protein